MFELKTIDTFEIQGRGTVHVVNVPPGCDGRALAGKPVILDGHVVKVKGVEAQAVPHPKNPFGLLV